jgi:hypothetical protein
MGQHASSHAERIASLVSRLDEATTRFVARLERAGTRAEQPRDGWSAAQIAAHVALVNDNFASLFDGRNPAPVPPPEGFVERSWAEIVRGIPERVTAPGRFVPPDHVSVTDALRMVKESASRLSSAIASVSSERARCCFTNKLVGTVTVYQAGDWAIAHIIRHNQQAKRVLGE